MTFAQDYVDVAERIREWYDRYPEGRITTEIVEFTENRATVKASAYRPDETRPAGVGHSYLSIPGTTNFTRGSELENAETSAVGRALVMAGIPAKNVASSSEVASKKTSGAALIADRSAGASTANANVGTAGDAKSTKASRDEATPASLPASEHLAGVNGAGSQSAEGLGEGPDADERAGAGTREGNPAPAPSNYLTKEEQRVFAAAMGGRVVATQTAVARFGDRVRGLDDLTREMATELVAAKVAG